jgi:integrase
LTDAKGQRGGGTVLALKTRAGVVTGYRALLPRHLSAAPPGHANPKTFRQPVGDTFATEGEAREFLDGAILQLQKNPYVGPGDTFRTYADLELEARSAAAHRDYPTPALARAALGSWKTARTRWVETAPFAGWPPRSVTADDVQDWVNWLTTRARSARGTPLASATIRLIMAFVKRAFARVKGLRPNPAAGLELPPRRAPRVPYLRLDNQRALLGRIHMADGKPLLSLADRVMIGCGMGAGLRIGELLAIEITDVHLDCEDPYLEINFGGAERSDTKAKKRRIVQLFEPGLGFWRLWLSHFYRTGSRLVFAGERGGYRADWPDQFPNWSTAAAFPNMTSHIMRHTYAVAVLSGSWGYEPRSMEFLRQQLGHSSVQITEYYYGEFAEGFSRDTVRRMTGRAPSTPKAPVTALELLGLTAPFLFGSALGSAVNVSERKGREKSRHKQKPRVLPETPKTPSKPPLLLPSLDRRSNHSEALDRRLPPPEIAGWWGPAAPPAVALAFPFLDAGPALRRDLPALAAAADSDDADAFADAFGRAMAEHAANLPGLSA